MNAVTVPEVEPAELVPHGWFESVADAVKEADWEELDDAEGRIRALASYVESFRGDALEMEKALRVIERRRGELSRCNTHVTADCSRQTLHRWRLIADHWEDVWPHILAAKRASEVTQAAVLRMVNGATTDRLSLKAERDKTLAVLRRICEAHGDNDWGDQTPVYDILTDHLEPHLG